MQYPQGVSEESFLAAVNHVAGVLSAKHQFGSHDKDDIIQMVAVHALQALPRFNPEKGNLEGFLYSHCSNRLHNDRRNELGCRSDSPCRTCYERALGNGEGHPDGSVCQDFAVWWNRRQTRARLANPTNVETVPEGESQLTKDSSVEADAAHHELLDLIDARLPVAIRADYLMMVAGTTHLVSIPRRRVVQREVAAILEEAGVELPEGVEELLKEGGKGKRRAEPAEGEPASGGTCQLERVGAGADADGADEQEGVETGR